MFCSIRTTTNQTTHLKYSPKQHDKSKSVTTVKSFKNNNSQNKEIRNLFILYFRQLKKKTSSGEKKSNPKVQHENSNMLPRPPRIAIRHHHTLPVTWTDVSCHCGQLEQMDGRRGRVIGSRAKMAGRIWIMVCCDANGTCGIWEINTGSRNALIARGFVCLKGILRGWFVGIFGNRMLLRVLVGH